MKKSVQSNLHKLKKAGCNAGLATILGGSLLALAVAYFAAPAHADPDWQRGPGIIEDSQVAELDQLAADFHGALSYGGDITAMMSLWTDHSSITLNGTQHLGKAAVQAFFQSSGYFLNNWVSLAPEYKTQITIHGGTADITTQCVAVDLSVSPMVVKSVIQVNATCEKIEGKWMFTSMNNSTPAPL